MHSMLRLARAEQWAAGARRDLETVEVAATCEKRWSAYGLARSRDVGVRFSAGEPAWLSADPEDLELIWANLLENAIRFSPPARAGDGDAGADERPRARDRRGQGRRYP